ncbi:MAG TPA: PfkB family carbohydrate kinase, partial [Acidimicrobiales bacterium]|nr:PfkB family carbohydrate kinase [Acidimicrobiales bacterium]
VRATKTGFLGSAGTVDVVARVAEAGRLANLVVDPVLVASTGAALFPPEVQEALVARLLPQARVITPNRTEAGLLVGRALPTLADMEAAAVELLDLGCEAVVVKGGDAEDEGDQAVDVLAVAGRTERIALARVDTPNDHGSGCSFAAATAARLALGDDVPEAVRGAKAFVHRALLGARDWRLGGGHGPIDAFGWDS